MTTQLSPSPVFKSWRNDGTPNAKGWMWTYAAGTTTPQATYTDSTGSQSNTNPVVFDARGEANVWLDPALLYKLIQFDSNGNQLRVVDNVNVGVSGVVPSSLIPTVDNTYTLGNSSFSWAQLYLGANHAPALNTTSGNIAYYKQTAAETTTGITVTDFSYPPGNLLRYGIVPNASGSATSNTSILVTLLNPANTGNVGPIFFPNTTGADNYYFNGLIDVRTGTRINLNGCTITFTRALTSADNFRGFLNFLTDVTIENGSIVVNITSTGGGITNAGGAIRIGSRPSYPFGIWPAGVWDQDTLVAGGYPLMGDVVLRNLYFQSNNLTASQDCIILMLGGLRNCTLENLMFDGQAVVGGAINYEFGFASSNGAPGTSSLWTSSHAVNMQLRNIRIQNMQTAASVGAIEIGGAHHCEVNGLVVDTANIGFYYYVGEATFYRCWTPTDNEGRKLGIIVRNMVATNVSTGLSLAGAWDASSGYLNAASPPLTDFQQLDLMQFDISNCVASASGIGIKVSGSFNLRNSLFDGASSSGQLLLTDDVSKFSIDNCSFLNSSSTGIRANFNTMVVTTAVTLTAGTASITAANNGVIANEAVIFTGSVGTVTGITAGQIYYVIATGLSSSAFQVALLPGGAAIVLGGAGTANVTQKPARLKSGTISNSLIAGNTTNGLGLSQNMHVQLTACRFGFSPIYDGVSESTQTNAISLSGSSNSGTCVCEGCYVTTSGGTAYVQIGSPAWGVLDVRNPKGEMTTSGVVAINGTISVTGATLALKNSYPNSYGGTTGPNPQTDKYAGKMAYNTTTNKLFVSQGVLSTSNWISVDGVTTITPV